MRKAEVKDNILEFILAGKALFTIVNKVNNSSMSFKVDKMPDFKKSNLAGDVWFVRHLTDPENRRSGQYLGYLSFQNGNLKYKHSYKSKYDHKDRVVQSFMWLMQNASSLPDQVQFWHEGRCGRCNRPLTDANSIENGYGPDCWQMIGALRQFDKLNQIADKILLGK